jgi:hypothetical protein
LRAPSHQSSNARDEFRECERFGQIVVCSNVEPAYAILDRVSGGQHQHREPTALITESTADFESVDVIEHDVENNRIVVILFCNPDGLIAGRNYIDGEPFLFQSSLQESRDLDRVLHDEDPHATTSFQEDYDSP